MIIREGTIEEAVFANKKIREFDEYTKEYFENKYNNKEHLILIAFDKEPVGYIISYDRYGKGSFYCWMAGVDYEHRRKGVLTKLMTYLFEWSRKKGYKKIRLKTRNNRREMLSYLIKNGFNFISVKKRKHTKDNRILAEKLL